MQGSPQVHHAGLLQLGSEGKVQSNHLLAFRISWEIIRSPCCLLALMLLWVLSDNEDGQVYKEIVSHLRFSTGGPSQQLVKLLIEEACMTSLP